MNPKKKIALSIVAFALVIVAVAASVVSALAAKKVTITNTVSVDYNSTDVYAVIIADWYAYDGNGLVLESGTLLPSTIITKDTSSITKGGMSISSVEEDTYILFVFIFSKYDAEYEDYKVGLTFTSSTVPTNITMTYDRNSNPAKGTTEFTSTNATLFEDQEITSTSPAIFYVRVQVYDETADSSFAGTFNWKLSNINQVTP